MSWTSTDGWITFFKSRKLRQYRWILTGLFEKSQYLTTWSSSAWSSIRRSAFGAFTSKPQTWMGPLSSCSEHSLSHLVRSIIISYNQQCPIKQLPVILRMTWEQNSCWSMEVGLTILAWFLIISVGLKSKTNGCHFSWWFCSDRYFLTVPFPHWLDYRQSKLKLREC